MKKVLSLIFLFASLSVKTQTKKTLELYASLHSVDKILPLENLHFVDSKIADGGDFTNKSLGIGLAGKYFFADNSAFSLQVIYTNRNIKDYRDLYAGIHTIYDIRIYQKLLKILPGIQLSTMNKKIAFLGGFNLPFLFYGKATQKTYYDEEKLDGSDKLHQEIEYVIPKGYIVGIGFFGGLNYYFVKKIAIGFMLGSAYQYTNVGGTLVSHSLLTTESNTSESLLNHTESIKSWGFAQLQSSIGLTWKIK